MKRISLVSVCMLLLVWSAGAAVAQPVQKSFKPEEIKKMAETRAVIETRLGNIELKFFPEVAPNHVKNFIDLSKKGFYDGTIFHRVIQGFMIQGGGFTPEMFPKPTKPPVANEADKGPRNDRGTIAMARTQDPHSATAQFFINLVNNEFLNHKGKTAQGWGYAAFGKVIEGMDIVDSIGKVQTGAKGEFRDVPVEPVVIQKAKVIGP